METDAKWASRVAAWRASGLTAPQFCAGKDFKAGGLRYWASRLKRTRPATARDVRIAKVVAPGTIESDTPIILELGGVRVAVRRGFDRDVLQQVIDVLGGRVP